MPGRFEPAERSGLRGAQALVDVDQMQVERGMEAGDTAGGPQRVGQQGTATGTELDQAYRLGASHGQPALGQPGA